MESSLPAATRPPQSPAVLALFDEPQPAHRLSRRRVEIDGIAYRLLLAVPKEAPPARGYPILYLLDGNAGFDLIGREELDAVAGLVVAGVAHDTAFRFDPPSRSRDYTPANAGGAPYPDPARPERLVGGAEAFLRRLIGPIRREAEAELAIDPARRMIFGHSLAGMFALYALLHAPESFARVGAASPSIWWNDEFMLRFEATAPAPDMPHDVLITLGDSERRSSPAGPHWDGPAPHTLEMIERLRKRPGIVVSRQIFEGLGHAATLPATLPLALDFAMRVRT